MAEDRRQDAFHKLMLALWAMVTMVLLFTVILLVNEMIESGRDPLEALRIESPEPANAEAPQQRSRDALGSREVDLYFAAADARGLVIETHLIEFGDSTVENCREALHKLIEGPRDILTPILPSNAKIRALYFLEDQGELVVDFSRELLSEHALFTSASIEALMAYGVVTTLTQPALRPPGGASVKQVRFLFEGLPPQGQFPVHIDLRTPVAPGQRWIALPGEPDGHV